MISRLESVQIVEDTLQLPFRFPEPAKVYEALLYEADWFRHAALFCSTFFIFLRSSRNFLEGGFCCREQGAKLYTDVGYGGTVSAYRDWCLPFKYKGIVWQEAKAPGGNDSSIKGK